MKTKKKVKKGRDVSLLKGLKGYGRAMAQALYSQDKPMRPKKKSKKKKVVRIDPEEIECTSCRTVFRSYAIDRLLDSPQCFVCGENDFVLTENAFKGLRWGAWKGMTATYR